MSMTDLLLDAITREAELRRKLTDADPTIRQVTITVKLDNNGGSPRAVEWEPKSHHLLRNAV